MIDVKGFKGFDMTKKLTKLELKYKAEFDLGYSHGFRKNILCNRGTWHYMRGLEAGMKDFRKERE